MNVKRICAYAALEHDIYVISNGFWGKKKHGAFHADIAQWLVLQPSKLEMPVRFWLSAQLTIFLWVDSRYVETHIINTSIGRERIQTPLVNYFILIDSDEHNSPTFVGGNLLNGNESIKLWESNR